MGFFYFINLQGCAGSLPDLFIQAGLPDFVIQAGNQVLGTQRN